MQVHAMTTVSTFDHLSSHGTLGGVGVGKFAHTSPLPGVFLSIGKGDIVTLDVKGTIVLIGLSGVVSGEVSAEDSGAVIWPIVHMEDLRAHSVGFITWGLEEAELSAELVGPAPGRITLYNRGS